MCDRERCAFCGRLALGLLMAWQYEGCAESSGHVCYGCEDRICTQMQQFTSGQRVRWLDTLEACK